MFLPRAGVLKERISYPAFRSCIASFTFLVHFSDAEGHVFNQSAFSAVEQIISLVPARLCMGGRQEKKLAQVGEVLVRISEPSGRLC